MLCFHAARIGISISCTICAIIVLGLAAYLLSVSHSSHRFSSNVFASLAISAASVTIVGLPLITIIFAWKKRISSGMIAAEIIVLFVAWVLWLSTAANTDRIRRNFFFDSCGFHNGFANHICREVKTVEAFAWILWVCLMVWFFFVCVCASGRACDDYEAGAPATTDQAPNQQGAVPAPSMQQHAQPKPEVEGSSNV